MLDLLISLAAMSALGVFAAVAGASLQRRSRNRPFGAIAVTVAEIATTSGMLAYMAWIWERPILAKLLPFSSIIILGNWLPIAGAFFAGICIATERISKPRRALFGTALGCLCCYSLISPLLGESPNCSPASPTGALLEPQTTSQTCSAACAAGLLRMHGIPATEKELSELCLTRQGTRWQGVFRGLKLKTAGTGWDVCVEEISGPELLKMHDTFGILALTFVENESHRAETGLARDVGHTVISFGVSDFNTLGVFDPAPDFGFESWNHKMIEGVEKAILLKLVARNGQPSSLQNIDTYRPSQWNGPTAFATASIRSQPGQ